MQDAKQEYISYEMTDERTKKNLERLFKTSKKSFWIRKRIFDVTVASASLIFLFPILVIIGIAIFIDDPHGSPIFLQKRIGRHGKEFTMYKFRSMFANAECKKDALLEYNEMDGPVFKIKNDPRVTRIGKFLRATSIDELPQLINVLKGDMSFVGPRPPLPQEVEQYDDYQRFRLLVTPGLTCIWQTAANRNDIPFNDWVEMDIEYIENRTMLKDIMLILKTVAVMFAKEGR